MGECAVMPNLVERLPDRRTLMARSHRSPASFADDSQWLEKSQLRSGRFPDTYNSTVKHPGLPY